MILREMTIEKYGYDPSTLTKGSHKRVCISCDDCGSIRDSEYRTSFSLKHLCKKCQSLGKNNGMYGKRHSEKTLKLQSNIKIGKDNPMYGIHRCGKDAPMYGKHPTEKTKQKIRDNRPDFSRKNNPHYKLEIDQFIKENQGKHFCQCGCGEEIKILRIYYTMEIPKFIRDHQHKGSNNGMWKGGLPLRDHVLPERDCIKLNSRFKGCEGHHLTSGAIIYLPVDLHKSIWHNRKSGQGVKEINEVAFNYLMGRY